MVHFIHRNVFNAWHTLFQYQLEVCLFSVRMEYFCRTPSSSYGFLSAIRHNFSIDDFGKSRLRLFLLRSRNSVNWPGPIFICQSLRKGCPISCSKFPVDLSCGTKSVSETKTHWEVASPSRDWRRILEQYIF